MEIITLGDIEVKIERIGQTVWVQPGYGSVQLQDNKYELKHLASVLTEGFDTAYMQYAARLSKGFDIEAYRHQLAVISVKVLLGWTYIYNFKKGDPDTDNSSRLMLQERDIFSVMSTDQIISYFRKLPFCDNWCEMCAALLNMTVNKFDAYYEERQKFWNMW